MGELIDDLLAFSRLGRNVLPTTEINMNSLVNTVIEEMTKDGQEMVAIDKEVLPPAFGQQALIKQVWINYISNAIKYSKNRTKIEIKIGTYSIGNEIVYYVEDNGAGFDMKYYEKLFGVFQRLHSNEEFEGTGIGLAVVQKVIQKHKGRVWAESILNKGSCFYFSLPKL